jgi:hypothetical protein
MNAENIIEQKLQRSDAYEQQEKQAAHTQKKRVSRAKREF